MTRCPHCAHALEHLSDETGKPPEPGDFILCTWCQGVGEFGADGELVARTWRELTDLSEIYPEDPTLYDLLSARHALVADKVPPS
jgi:hypothetical protein